MYITPSFWASALFLSLPAVQGAVLERSPAQYHDAKGHGLMRRVGNYVLGKRQIVCVSDDTYDFFLSYPSNTQFCQTLLGKTATVEVDVTPTLISTIVTGTLATTTTSITRLTATSTTTVTSTQYVSTSPSPTAPARLRRDARADLQAAVEAIINGTDISSVIASATDASERSALFSTFSSACECLSITDSLTSTITYTAPTYVTTIEGFLKTTDTVVSTRGYTVVETVTVTVSVAASDPGSLPASSSTLLSTSSGIGSPAVSAILPTVTIPSFTCPDNHEQVVANWIGGQQYRYEVFCDALVQGVGSIASFNYSSPADCAAACSELDYRLNGVACKAISFNATATTGDNCFLYGDVPALVNSPGIISALLQEIILDNGAPFNNGSLSTNATGTRAGTPEETSSAISAVANPAVITAPPVSCPATVQGSTYFSSGTTLPNGFYSYTWSWSAYTAECWISSWATAMTQVYASTWTVISPGGGASAGATGSAGAGVGGGVYVTTFVSDGVTIVSTIASAGATGGGIASATAAASGALSTVIVTNQTTIVSMISGATGGAGMSATGGSGGGLVSASSGLVPFSNATTVLSDGATVVLSTGGVDLGFTSIGATGGGGGLISPSLGTAGPSTGVFSTGTEVVLSTGGVDISLGATASGATGGGLIPPASSAVFPNATSVGSEVSTVVIGTGGAVTGGLSTGVASSGGGLVPPAPTTDIPAYGNSTMIMSTGGVETGLLSTGLSTGGSGLTPPSPSSPVFPNVTSVDSAGSTVVIGTGGFNTMISTVGTAVSGGGLIPPAPTSAPEGNATSSQTLSNTGGDRNGMYSTGSMMTGTGMIPPSETPSSAPYQNSTGPSGTEAPPPGTGGPTAPLTTDVMPGPSSGLSLPPTYGPTPSGQRSGTASTASTMNSTRPFVPTEVPTMPPFPTAPLTTGVPPLSTGVFPNETIPSTCPCLPPPTTCPPVPVTTVTVREYITITNCADCLSSSLPSGPMPTGLPPSYGPGNTTLALRRAYGETATQAQIDAACANTDSLVYNGGFEVTSADFGAQGWTDSTTSTSIYFLTHASTTAHGGTREGRFVSSDTAATIRISQPLTLCPGTSYALSAYHRQSNDLMQCEVWYSIGGEEVFSDQPGTVYEGRSNFYTAGSSSADVSVDLDITVRCSGQPDVDGQMVTDIDDVNLRAV